MTDDRTEIQHVIDYLRELYPEMNVVQYGSTEESEDRDTVVSVQEVIKDPIPKWWGNILDYDPVTEKATVGYDYQVSYKIHCISYLSFDEADKLADAIERAFKFHSHLFNTTRRKMMWDQGIIKVGEFHRRPDSTYDELEPEVNRVIIDVDMRMRRLSYIKEDVPALKEVKNWDITVD